MKQEIVYIKSRQVYNGIDTTKLFCAFLIVYLHSYNYDGGTIALWFKDAISTVGVPFFFITSGYFLTKGLIRNDWSIIYIKRYVFRVLKMYIAWTIITLPVSWLCIEWGHSDYSFPLKVVYLFRMILFSGSCGIYWYLLALMECSLILFFCVKKRVETSMYIFAVILFIIGIAYNSPLNRDNYLFQFIHIVFGSERNFLNTGLLYICAGFYIANHSIQPNKITLIIALATSILLRTIEIQYIHANFFQSLIAISLFLFAQQTNIRINDSVSLQIRKMSIALYLLHFPFLLVYDYHFSRNTISGFISATAFSLVTFLLLKHFTSEKTMKLLFG